MVEINKEDIKKLTFDNIASLILNKYILNIQDKHFGITEIEFYNYSKKHPDPYVQLDNEQKIFGNLYFNKTRSGTYKTGTNMGININLGDSDTYFYVLIRSLINIETHIFTETPNKCVDMILDIFKYGDIDSFMKKNNDKIYDLINLKKIEDNKLDIFFGPRIGLVLFSPAYFHKKYRYAVNIKMIKTQNNFISINNTQNDIKTNTHNNIKTNTHNDIKTNTHNNIKTNTQNDIKTNTHNNIKTNTHNNIKTNTHNNIKTNTHNDIKTNTQNDIKTNTQNEIKTNTQNEIDNNIINNVIIEDNIVIIEDNSKIHKKYVSSLVKNSIYNNIKIQQPRNNIQENININKPIPAGMIPRNMRKIHKK
jgi:hypothetical protein